MTISGEAPIDSENERKNYMHRQVEQQLQTILNLFNSGIPPETIADQVDIDKDEVDQILQDIKNQEERKRILLEEQVSNNPSLGSAFYLDAVVDIEQALRMLKQGFGKLCNPDPNLQFQQRKLKAY